MKIGIITRTLLEGDAVSNDVVGMYVSLKKHGHEPVLYAEYARINLPVNSIQNIPNGKLGMIIYHHSIGWNPGTQQFLEFKGRKIIKWHNITPPHFFQDAVLYNLCKDGWEQLPKLLSTNCELWCDSEYNAQDILKIREMPYKIIPPYNQSDILLRSQADLVSVQNFNDWKTNVIMIGRVAANKNITGGIEGFANYYEKNKNSRLFIIGDSATDHIKEVKEKITELKLPNIVITGKVGIELLKSFYMIADVLLITSKHEGFCVPLVEAFAMGVPVIASESTAIPYTGQDAVYYASTPNEIATGIDNLIKNKSIYIDRGKKLFKEKYHNAIIESLLLSAVNSIQA